MKKLAFSFNFILSFTFVVLGDIALPPPSDIGEAKEQNHFPPRDNDSKNIEKQTCAGIIMFSAAMFLFGHWLIK